MAAQVSEPAPAARGEPVPAPRADGAPARDATGSASQAPDAPALQAPAAHPDAAARAPADTRLAARERLGTGHGARETSYATTVAFERATSDPEEIVRVRYDSLDNLIAAGIVPRSYAAATPPHPRPFPLDEGFVPDPPLP